MLVFRFSRISGKFEITGSKGITERPRGHFRPPVDIAFYDGVFTVNMDIPGVEPDDLSIETTDSEISIVGLSRSREAPGVCRLMERSAGHFLRSISFPGKIEPDGVRAELKNGVLTVTVPAPELTRDPTRIVIRVEGAD